MLVRGDESPKHQEVLLNAKSDQEKNEASSLQDLKT